KLEKVLKSFSQSQKNQMYRIGYLIGVHLVFSILSPTILLKRAKLTSIQTNYLRGGPDGISDSIDIYRIS
ncbi:MAG TPA: hypothetical protein VNB68_00895, partial [Nitrososphaeraceae archaeon]|nr:hypothetical protein [Nitrososphaeraceae archaeon]